MSAGPVLLTLVLGRLVVTNPGGKPGCSAVESGGDVGREPAGGDGTPPDQGLVRDAHGLPVLVPVGVLAGDAAEVLDQAVEGLRHVQHVGVAVNLDPRTVPVVGEDQHGDLRVPLRVPGLRPGRIGGDDDPVLGVDATGDAGDLRPASRRVVASSIRTKSSSSASPTEVLVAIDLAMLG